MTETAYEQLERRLMQGSPPLRRLHCEKHGENEENLWSFYHDHHDDMVWRCWPCLVEAACQHAEELERLTEALRAIRNYEPEEVCKDEFAYDRVVQAFHDAATAALEESDGK